MENRRFYFERTSGRIGPSTLSVLGQTVHRVPLSLLSLSDKRLVDDIRSTTRGTSHVICVKTVRTVTGTVVLGHKELNVSTWSLSFLHRFLVTTVKEEVFEWNLR